MARVTDHGENEPHHGKGSKSKRGLLPAALQKAWGLPAGHCGTCDVRLGGPLVCSSTMPISEPQIRTAVDIWVGPLVGYFFLRYSGHFVGVLTFHGNIFYSTAYKEKMKELPLVSLFCSCFLSDPLNKPSYKYEGRCTNSSQTFVGLGWLLLLLIQSYLLISSCLGVFSEMMDSTTIEIPSSPKGCR